MLFQVPTPDSVVVTDSVIPGYKVVPLEWSLDVGDGKDPLHLTGTVEQVLDQLKVSHPEFEAKVEAAVAAAPPLSTVATETSENPAAAVVKRWEYEGHFCFGRWQRTNRNRIWEGVMYLRRVGGRPWMNPGPGTCARVSCSYDSAIYWCNDANFVRTLDSFANIADAANEIINLCIQEEFNYQWSSGQYFYREKWNVIVRQDKC